MATLKNLKTSVAFPEIGRIRKGGPKVKRVKDNREYSTVGPDLNDKFRVVFAPGEEGAVEQFMTAYQTLQPQTITAMLPFASIDEVWDASYTAYNAGRLVARADGEKYLYKVNPAGGEVEVQDGEPFVPFHHGETIHYERNGKPYALPVKPLGMLKLFLPIFGRIVYLTLVTTSIYDIINITKQLNAIALIAGALNKTVAGIPLKIYRKPQEITWVKEDGSATRITKWIINIEIHPDAVKPALAGLQAGSIAALLPPTASEITTHINPDTEDMGDAEDDDEVKGEWGEEDPAPAEPAASAAVPEAPPQPAMVHTTSPDDTNRQTPPKAAVASGETGPFGMSLATANTLKTKEGDFYKDIPTDKLAYRLNIKLKIPTGQRTEEDKLKIDAMRTIIYYRSHGTQQ